MVGSGIVLIRFVKLSILHTRGKDMETSWRFFSHVQPSFYNISVSFILSKIIAMCQKYCNSALHNHTGKVYRNILACSDSRGMRKTFSRLSKLEGTTNLIRLLLGHVKYF